MPRKRPDRRGECFGGTRVLRFSHCGASGHLFYVCLCVCGKRKTVCIESLRRTPGCHCRHERHRMWGTHFYRAWVEMNRRCRRDGPWKTRGIRVHWKTFAAFKRDLYATYQRHVRRYGMANTSLDRRNNDGDYCKANCRWATRHIQGNNQRTNRRLTLDGVTRTMTEWAQLRHWPVPTLFWRLAHGWSIRRALTTPQRRREI